MNGLGQGFVFWVAFGLVPNYERSRISTSQVKYYWCVALLSALVFAFVAHKLREARQACKRSTPPCPNSHGCPEMRISPTTSRKRKARETDKHIKTLAH